MVIGWSGYRLAAVLASSDMAKMVDLLAEYRVASSGWPAVAGPTPAATVGMMPCAYAGTPSMVPTRTLRSTPSTARLLPNVLTSPWASIAQSELEVTMIPLVE